ncbi:MAG TPA: hypothetical protein VLH86_03740 [Patescibacteria group bacterium]|nr:hypothetical protein [Patescibacteria group bacterium]
MKSKKPLIMAGVGAVVGLAAFAGVASAQTPTITDNGQQTLVDKIATRFNLNKSDVQAVFDEDRTAHQAEMKQRMDDRLTQAVKDGKITEAQKTLIENKQQELQTYIESIKDKTPAERKTLMRAKLTEVEQWAKDNGLTDYFHAFAGGPGGHKGGMEFKADTEVNDDSN